MQKDRTLEEIATDMLRDDAKAKGTTLYRQGIIDERRRRTINSREIPLSKFDKKGL